MSADTEYEQAQEKPPPAGAFVRKPTSFRRKVGRDGDVPAAANRYLLVVSLACPWANRTLILRKLKGLESAIAVCVVDWLMKSEGWHFSERRLCSLFPPRPEFTHVRDLYLESDPKYEGRFTVPVLYDLEERRIVNNESSEIIRMLNTEFNAFSATPGQAALDLYPEALRGEIDAVNEWVYPAINNGVYRQGFASTQEAYDSAHAEMSAALDRVEEILSRQRYLCGDRLTEADVRLFVTLVRFDAVYTIHFKCVRRVADMPNTSAYVRDVYQHPGVAETVDFGHIVRHYYESHSINVHGIVPAGTVPDLTAPHGRASQF